MRTFAKIIGYGLVLLLIVAAIGFAYKYTNGFNEDLKTFYVEYGGKQILTTESKMTLKSGDVHRFNVKYTFDKDDAEPKDYKVKIVPNVTRDFDFTVDGEKHIFSKVGDLTAVFAPVKSQTYFELSLPETLSLKEVLKKAYNGTGASVPEDAEKNNPYPYTLVISSYNDKVTYNIDFTFSAEGTPSGNDTPTTPTQPSEGGNTPSVPVTPGEEKKYCIDYDTLGWGSANVTCPATAKAGETVNVTVSAASADNEISHVVVTITDTDEEYGDFELTDGAFVFTMPEADVMLTIYVIPIEDSADTVSSVDFYLFQNAFVKVGTISTKGCSTWGDWVNSSNNTYGCFVDGDGKVRYPNGDSNWFIRLLSPTGNTSTSVGDYVYASNAVVNSSIIAFPN